MKPNKKSVAKRLHLIKEEKNLTIQELGEAVGSTKENFKSYLRGLAVPPEDIIENLAVFSGRSKMWIYYGEEIDKIKDYISFKGHEKLVEEFPEEISTLYDKYKKIIFDTDGLLITSRLMFYFNFVFKDIMYIYITDILEELNIKEEVLKHPLYSSDEPEANFIRFEREFIEKVFWELPNIKYGEKEKIINVANEALRDYIELYNIYGSDFDKPILFKLEEAAKNSKSVKLKYFLIDKLKTYDGTKELLDLISSEYEIEGKIIEEDEKKLVNTLQSLYKPLRMM